LLGLMPQRIHVMNPMVIGFIKWYYTVTEIFLGKGFALDKIVVFNTFLNVNEAHLVKGLLESHGIKSFLFDELAVTFVPLVGGVRLMVRESDLAEARQVLAREGV